MIVKCSDCNASYSVDDTKVMNKKFAFTCPKCGSNVIIDNRIQHSIEQVRVAERVGSPVGIDRSSVDSSASRHSIDDAISASPTPPSEERLHSSQDFMDFDLASDDEALLKQDFGKKQSSVGLAETESTEDESLNLDDFDMGTESAAVRDEVPQKSPEATLGDDLKLDDLALDLLDEKPKKTPDRIAVDQDDFKPLEEDITFDELERASGTTTKDSAVKSEDILVGHSDDTDESITIDLDSLDIQLDESTVKSQPGAVSATTEELNISSELSSETAETDESITLDLDSLDITLDEVEEFKEGVTVDEEDERLTLDDAGITIDEIEAEKHESPIDAMQETEEELKLSIDEVAPSLEREISGSEIHNEASIISEIDESELPEIDFDKLESAEPLRTSRAASAAGIAVYSSSHTGISPSDVDNYLDIETRNDFEQYKIDIETSANQVADTVPGGAINFSVDYSLSHSRIKALLRLFGLYYILFIPHFLVLLIYSMLSSILAGINWIIVLLFGYHMEDFLVIIAKTMRYMLSLNACATATTDDLPAFSGQKNIDHAIQFDVIYPSNPSRVLAALRLSFIGIHLLLLPHYIIISLLTIGMFFISLIGILSIIVMKRLPNILFDFMVRYFRYLSNIMGYQTGLVDKYPSFRFE